MIILLGNVQAYFHFIKVGGQKNELFLESVGDFHNNYISLLEREENKIKIKIKRKKEKIKARMVVQ